MQLKSKLCALACVALLFPSIAGAALVFEINDFITGKEGIVFPFTANVEPLTYKATLTDLSDSPDETRLEFDALLLLVSTSDANLAMADAVSNGGSDTCFFDVELGQHLFAGVAGKGIGPLGMGYFGLKIESVPIPASVLLLGSALVAVVGLSRRRNKEA